MPKAWLAQLVEDVSSHVISWDGDVPLQCHVFHNNDQQQDEWEVTLFGEPQTFGGRLASLSYDSCLSVSVLHVAGVFEDIDACHWQTANVDASDELGPHLAITGKYQGRRVWLRILGRAPERLREAAIAVPRHLAD